MTATATSNYIGQAMRATFALAPLSLADNPGLLAWNLFVMTAAFCLELMMAGQQVRRLWQARAIDHPTDRYRSTGLSSFSSAARSPAVAVPKPSAFGPGARGMPPRLSASRN